MKSFRTIFIYLLMFLSFYVAVNLLLGNGARWFAITAYWIVLSVKNLIDVVMEEYNDRK